MSKQWIAVADGLPEKFNKLNESEYMLCVEEICQDIPFTAWYNSETKEWTYAHYKMPSEHPNVTYWQPLNDSPATPLPQTEVGEALKAIDQELLWHQVVNFFQGEYVNNPHTTKEEIIRDLMQHYTITKKQ